MTEAEWLTTASRGDDMIAHVRDRGSSRLWRLLLVAAVRGNADDLTYEESRGALDVAERYADDEASAEERRMAQFLAASAEQWSGYDEWEQEARSNFCVDAAYRMAIGAHSAAESVTICLVEEVTADDIPPRFRLPDLIREVFGNPFRLPDVPLWCLPDGGEIHRLASSIYDSKRFDELPILADALEEFGCADAPLLEHLRSPGPHVRGCWALDLVLGKE